MFHKGGAREIRWGETHQRIGRVPVKGLPPTTADDYVGEKKRHLLYKLFVKGSCWVKKNN